MSNTVRYQLRRVPPALTPLASALNLIPLDVDVLKFGRNPDHVQVVLHSTVYSNMISREHAEVRKHRNADGTIAFYLHDKSLNGTYINEHRVKSSVLLHPGDVIKFGHVNGAAILPGSHAPQPQAEFTFVFEKQSRGNSGNSCDNLMQMSNKQQAINYQQTTQNAQFHPQPQANPYANTAVGAAGQRLVAAYQQQGITNQVALNAYHRAALLSHPAYAAALYGYARPPAQQPQQQQQPHWPQQQHTPVTCSVSSYSSCAVDTATTSSGTVGSAARWGFASTPAGMFPLHQVAAFQQARLGTSPGVVTCSSPSSAPFSTTSSVSLDTKCDAVCSPPLVRAADSSALKAQSPICHSPPLSVGSNQPHTIVSVAKTEPESSALSDSKDSSTTSCDKLLNDDIKRMECDSSVPSPPKTKQDEESSLSQSLRALAASAAENSRLLYNSSPHLLPSDKEEKEESSPQQVKITKKSNEKSHKGRRRKGRNSGSESKQANKMPKTPAEILAEPVKNRRKSNEVSRLLNDLTEGIFMTIVAGKKPSPSKKKKKGQSDSEESASVSSRSASPVVAKNIPVVDSPATREKEKRSPIKKRKGFRSPPPEEAGPSNPPKKYKDDDEDASSDTSLQSPPTPKRSRKTAAARHKLKVQLNKPPPRPRRSEVKRKTAPRTPPKRRTLSPARGNRLGFIPPPIAIEQVNKRSHKKRGRPKKGDLTVPPPIEPAIDPWNYHDAGEKCHSKDKCRMPQEDNVDWIECDDCNEWYHVFCVKEKVDLEEEDFHCGCQQDDDDDDD